MSPVLARLTSCWKLLPAVRACEDIYISPPKCLLLCLPAEWTGFFGNFIQCWNGIFSSWKILMPCTSAVYCIGSSLCKQTLFVYTLALGSNLDLEWKSGYKWHINRERKNYLTHKTELNYILETKWQQNICDHSLEMPCSNWLILDYASGNLNIRQCQFCAAVCHSFISAGHTDVCDAPAPEGLRFVYLAVTVQTVTDEQQRNIELLVSNRISVCYSQVF